MTEYNLGELPALVYYRHTIPILYEGALDAEDDILEWLIQNRSSGDEDDVIEEVQFKGLEAMVAAVENIAVLFCKFDKTSDKILTAPVPQTIQSQPKLMTFWRAWRPLMTIATTRACTLSRSLTQQQPTTTASPPCQPWSTSRTVCPTCLTVSDPRVMVQFWGVMFAG